MMPPGRDERELMDGRNSSFLVNMPGHEQHHTSNGQSHNGLSKAELRKSNKPIMEKKRRARINHCLNELKTLILEAMKKDPARHTKLEKADILEMTVKYLQSMQRNQISMGVQSDPTVLHKFKAGFADCTDEVNRYISQIDGVDTGVKQRLIGHLNTCVGGLQQVSPPYTNYTNNYRSPVPYPNNTMGGGVHAQSAVLPLPQDVNNNGRIQMGGVQLIPSRLPTGELALVMPNSSNLPYFPSSTFPTGQNTIDLTGTRPRVSAFNSVAKAHSKHLSTDTSPPLSPASTMSSEDESLPPPEYQVMTSTPPLQSQQNMLNAFPTPPSGGSITISMVAPPSNGLKKMVLPTSNSVTLQQQQVTSTTEPPQTTKPTGLKVKPLSVITNTAANLLINSRSDVQYVNKKRPYPIDLSSDEEIMKVYKYEPSEKLFKSDSPAQNQNDDDNEQANGDMWRPW